MPPAARPIVGIDLGTARLGVVVAHPTLPLRVVDADVLDVNPLYLAPSADWIRAGLDEYAVNGIPPDVVVEFAPLYIPDGASAAKARAMAGNHSIMKDLLNLIYAACPGPVYQVAIIGRRSWSARVVPGHKGGITNAESNAGLADHLDPAGRWPLIQHQDTRDAAGAIVGYLLGAPHREARQGKSGAKRKQRPYVSPPRVIARRAAEAAQDAVADRCLAAGIGSVSTLPLPIRLPSPCCRPCGCGLRGRHRRGCTRYPGP